MTANPERTGSKAGACLLCEGWPNWTLVRVGDARVTWSCDVHLTQVAVDFVDEFHAELRLNRWIDPARETASQSGL